MPRPMKRATPHRRGGYWYLVRRVPSQFAAFDDRGIIQISTGIAVADDPRAIRATEAVRKLDDELMRFWEAKRAGNDPDAEARFRKAKEDAQRAGFTYATATALRDDSVIDELLRRMEFLATRDTVEKFDTVNAVLGGEPEPQAMLGTLVADYEHIIRVQFAKKSPAQKQRWRVARQTALANFIEGIGGDRALNALTRNDILAYRDKLQERVLTNKITTDTANKAIGRVASMFRAVSDDRHLNLPPVFDRIIIRGEKTKQRVAYPVDFVQSRFMAEGVFDDLNEEARRVIYLIAETGLRLSEACNLTQDTIRLDSEIPHVVVLPDEREMKTEQSQREIPLVGAALMAMKLQPNGFPRYRDKASSLSALVNKALKARKLTPLPGQSLYSLRHTFEDRLTEVEAPEKLVASLMGHKWHRERYGKGPSLSLKLKWLNRIAFRPPSAV